MSADASLHPQQMLPNPFFFFCSIEVKTEGSKYTILTAHITRADVVDQDPNKLTNIT